MIHSSLNFYKYYIFFAFIAVTIMKEVTAMDKKHKWDQEDWENLNDWSKKDWEDLNTSLKEMGLPTLIIENDVVYKDILHQYLGIGFLIGGPK